MLKFGLIGTSLKHTFSPRYFTTKFRDESIDAQYLAYELESIHDLNSVLSEGLVGFNVTMPYKEKIIPFLARVSAEAAAIGAVNTVYLDHGQLVGYNTDVIGFRQSLLSFIGDKRISCKALVLGTGGASKAVSYVLTQLGIKHLFVSRSKGDIHYGQIDESILKNHTLIINTTPLGMYPLINIAPKIPMEYIKNKHYMYDLIYNPNKTLFLKQAAARGAKIKNGTEMLKIQADAAWNIWNRDIDTV